MYSIEKLQRTLMYGICILYVNSVLIILKIILLNVARNCIIFITVILYEMIISYMNGVIKFLLLKSKICT